MALIYKIIPEALWREAEAEGELLGAAVDLADGFIHFSTSAQVRETAAKHFQGQQDLLLIAVDAGGLGDALKWEPSRGGDLFPHLYRSLRTSEAVWAAPLPINEHGAHQFPTTIDDPS